MRKIGMVCAAAAMTVGISAAERPLRVLMIGNSFSFSVMAQLPKIVDSQQKFALDITSMYIGGCSLERHMKEYRRSLDDPAHRPYNIDRFVSGRGRTPRVPGSLPEQLNEAPFDVITIQQASPLSFRPESWVPWGDQLVELVREKQPKAKIVIQQTWSYHQNAPLLARWRMSSAEMFGKIRALCEERAVHFGCGIIPTGEAVSLFRGTASYRVRSYSAEELAQYAPPRLPPCRGDMAGAYRWRKDRKTGAQRLVFDGSHLNRDGEYLQGCVWFGALFGADVEKIAYAPEFLTPDAAAVLRNCAAQALARERERLRAEKTVK